MTGLWSSYHILTKSFIVCCIGDRNVEESDGHGGAQHAHDGVGWLFLLRLRAWYMLFICAYLVWWCFAIGLCICHQCAYHSPWVRTSRACFNAASCSSNTADLSYFPLIMHYDCTFICFIRTIVFTDRWMYRMWAPSRGISLFSSACGNRIYILAFINNCCLLRQRSIFVVIGWWQQGSGQHQDDGRANGWRHAAAIRFTTFQVMLFNKVLLYHGWLCCFQHGAHWAGDCGPRMGSAFSRVSLVGGSATCCQIFLIHI